MHRLVFDEFDRLCRHYGAGGAVLEIGAMPAADTLLCLPALAAATERIGVNPEGPHEGRDFSILQARGNSLEMFADGYFDTVLCNAVLEHDPQFWLTLAEIRRLIRPGGLAIIGVPGFLRREPRAEWLRRVPGAGKYLEDRGGYASVPTLGLHDFPQDYYRFSPQAVREVLLSGLEEVELCVVMQPPRIIGVGRRPA